MKALVIGGTGLVGSQLLDILIADSRFSEVVVLTRHHTNYTDPKIVEHIVDLGDPSTWRELLYGDILFSSLGTTLKKAGDKMAQYEVDYTFQYNFAAAAAGNGVGRYVLVSSLGADPSSWFFYLRIKGELEEKVVKLPFESISVLRPSQLYGPRKEERPDEERSISAMKFINSLGIMTERRPIHARTVASAMIEAALTGSGVEFFEPKDIRLLSAQYNDYLIASHPEKEILATTSI